MFLINKGGCCKPPVHSQRISLQPFMCRLPALPGVTGKKKPQLVCISHTDEEVVCDGATFYKSDFKGAACLAPQGWSERWNGAQTLKMTAILHWIWSARHVVEKNKIKGLRVKQKGGGDKQHMAQRRNPTLRRTLPERLTGETNLPAKTDGEKHCHMKPQRRSSGLLSTSNRAWTHSTGRVFKWCLERRKMWPTW